MDIHLKLVLLFLLSTPTIGRVRREGTLEGHPVLPFSAQSNSRDESPSLEVQNQDAEKGVIDQKDAMVEEVIQYVDDSEPGMDPEVAVDQLAVDEEPDMDSVVQDDAIGGAGSVARVYNEPRGTFFERPYFGYQNNSLEATTTAKPEDKPWYKNSTIWIIVGVVIGLILIAILVFCCCCKKKQ